MTDIAFKTAAELAADLADKQVGALELLDHFIARVEKHDGALNAVVVRDFERARDAARTVDAARARGEDVGPLQGLPMTVKESHNIAGLKTTWGSPDFADNVAGEDSVVVQRLKRAGAVVFGKTNIPLMLADWQSYNEVYGQTNNPHDLGRSPGGSSGGCAAAVAAGLSGLEIGSDIGGSIRNPAAFCGVYGLKPTWDVVPLVGHALFPIVTTPDISVTGPIARGVDDLEMTLDLIAGPTGVNAHGWQLDLPKEPRTSLADFRIAVWDDCDIAPVDAAVGEKLQAATEILTKAGATVDTGARPDIDPQDAYRLYLGLLFAVIASRQPPEAIEGAKTALPDLTDDDISASAMFVRGATYGHGDWLAMNERRNQMRLTWDRFFRDYDLLLCPVHGTPAFPHDHLEPQDDRRLTINGNPESYFQQIFWAGLTGMVHLPAVSAPIGRSPGGLPIGLQIVAPHLHDRRAIAFARLLAREIGGYEPPSGFA